MQNIVHADIFCYHNLCRNLFPTSHVTNPKKLYKWTAAKRGDSVFSKMRFLIVVLCLLKLAQTEFSEKYKIVRVDLKIPDSYEGFGFNGISESRDRSARLAYGLTAAEGQFPWAALIETQTPQGSRPCSGSILNPRFILSSHRCIR